MFKLKHEEGATAASWGGHEFIADAEGLIAVPAHAIADLASHGWRTLEELAARAKGAAQAAPELSQPVAERPVDHLNATLTSMAMLTTEQFDHVKNSFGLSDKPIALPEMAAAVLTQAEALPAELIARFQERFAKPAADPVETFIDHLKTLDVPSIDKVLEGVIPRVKGIMDEKAPPPPSAAPPQEQQPPADQQQAAQTGGAQ
jgi:hypothetical protein